MNVTNKLLAAVHPTKGRYLAVRLTKVHTQPECTDVPANTVGIIKGCLNGHFVFVFPHTVLNEKIKAFSDGNVRIIDAHSFTPIGRVG